MHWYLRKGCIGCSLFKAFSCLYNSFTWKECNVTVTMLDYSTIGQDGQVGDLISAYVGKIDVLASTALDKIEQTLRRQIRLIKQELLTGKLEHGTVSTWAVVNHIFYGWASHRGTGEKSRFCHVHSSQRRNMFTNRSLRIILNTIRQNDALFNVSGGSTRLESSSETILLYLQWSSACSIGLSASLLSWTSPPRFLWEHTAHKAINLIHRKK